MKALGWKDLPGKLNIDRELYLSTIFHVMTIPEMGIQFRNFEILFLWLALDDTGRFF